MAMLHIHAYPCRPPEDIELLVNPGRRGRISRRVVRSLRDHVASPFTPSRARMTVIREIPSSRARDDTEAPPDYLRSDIGALVVSQYRPPP